MTQWPDLKRGLVAILRGVKPDEIAAIGDALVEAGFEAIEIPLNSPLRLSSMAARVAMHLALTLVVAVPSS